MTINDTIQGICEALGKCEHVNKDGTVIVWKPGPDGLPFVFRPDTDHNDAHLLIGWMEAEGWEWRKQERDTVTWWKNGQSFRHTDPNFCRAVVYAAAHALGVECSP